MHTEKDLATGEHDALIVVDVQNDFLPGGALAVNDGDAVIPVINECIRLSTARRLPIYATRDWHPADHCSFADNGGMWPKHCVADSPGAQFAEGLALPDDGRARLPRMCCLASVQLEDGRRGWLASVAAAPPLACD